MPHGRRILLTIPMVAIADDGCHETMAVEIETFKHDQFWPTYDSSFLAMCSSCMLSGICSESWRLRESSLNFFRIISVTARVQRVVNSPARLPPGTLWGEWARNKASDSRGHVIARQLGGPACPFNLFPQNICTNRYLYYEVEKTVAQNVDKYGDPTIRVRLHYYPFLFKPRPFSVSFTIMNFGTKIRIKNNRATNGVNWRTGKEEFISSSRSAGRVQRRIGKKLGKIEF